VFHHRVQRKIFGRTREGVRKGWRKLQNVEIYHIINLMKSRRVGGHAAHMEGTRIAYKIWSEILNGRDHWEDLGVDGRIILQLILRRYSSLGTCGLDSSGWDRDW
jgi:hypothetical protein